MTSIKASDLAGLVGKIVVVQVDVKPTSDDGDTFREVTGKLIAATPDGLVIQNKSGSEIITFNNILDVDEAIVKRSTRVIRRLVSPTGRNSNRQHLLDRHGLNVEFVRTLSREDAMLFHAMIKHDALGHQHGAKPAPKAGLPALPPDIVLHPASAMDSELGTEEAEETTLDVPVISGGQAKSISRLDRRYIEEVTETSVRQHLTDRHGLPYEAIRSLSPAEALMLHRAVDHSKIGHTHGVKPIGRPGRPMSIKRIITTKGNDQ